MKNVHYIIFVSLCIIGCANKSQHQDTIPKHDTFKIESKHVSEERVINVWVPPIYENSKDSLPVIYMPDGGIKEDFPHIANTIAKLVQEKSIPPIILVGIENTVRRRDLTGASEVKEDEQYCPLTDGASNFRKFITEELFSEIHQKYRVTNKKGMIGESLAGLFVVETFMLTRESFDFYIAMDPSLWWNDHYLVRNSTTLLNDSPNKKTKLWFAGSSAKDISTHTVQLAKDLKNNAFDTLEWKYSNEPNEEHHTIFRATKEKAIKWALGD